MAILSLPRDVNILNNYFSKTKSEIKESIDHKDIDIINIHNNIKLIENKIKTLVESLPARIVAVHRVITNKGYRSPGATKEKLPNTNNDYVKLVEWLKVTCRHPKKYKATPLSRIYIPKKTKIDINKIEKPTEKLGDTFSKVKDLRPLSIPTIKDRCLQALFYIGYTIFSEYIADPHSYAFRPGRSPAWAAHQIDISLKSFYKPTWVVEIDINKCFDSINHEFIIKNTPFIPKIILRSWLKQGYLLKNFHHLGVFETNSGIPQGGIISPVICNTVLDGAEAYILNRIIELIKNKNINVEFLGYSKIRPSNIYFKLIRYADDIVILTRSKKAAETCKHLLEEFLLPRGLLLSETKTRLTNISGGIAEFNFVGYNFKKITFYTKSKWLINPTTENVSRIMKRLKVICLEKTSIKNLYFRFNSVIKSWTNYYITTNASKAFERLHSWIFKVFYQAVSRRLRGPYRKLIPNINRRRNISKKAVHKYIIKTYIRKIYYKNYKNKWFTFFSRKLKRMNRNRFVLFSPKLADLISYEKGPFTGSRLNYHNIEDLKKITTINLNFRTGLKRNVLIKNKKKYDGICLCPSCQVELFDTIGHEFHHKLPLEFGGLTNPSNIIVICTKCHYEISKNVRARNLLSCLDYINNDLLKIPTEILEKAFR